MPKIQINENFANYNIIFPERTIDLHAMFVNCGHQRVTTPAYCWDSATRGDREFLIWQYTYRGAGALKSGGKLISLLPQQAFLVTIPSNEVYFYPESAKEPWEFIYCTLYGSEVMRLGTELLAQAGPVLNYAKSSNTLALAESIFECAGAERLRNKFQASAWAYEFMMTLHDDFQRNKSSGERPEFMDRVLDYCLKNFHREITLDELAQLANLSKFYFTRCFHKYQQLTPLEFVQALRLKMAIQMLQTEQFSVKEIAERCGFESASYFGKIFRRTYKVSPGEFRRSGRIQ
ncbi:MAG: AraC family transcriptional regulator [Lentisphaeria bacterium]|nr:AraC family transcriptional regulator [Lentisphaeria bacterium]